MANVLHLLHWIYHCLYLHNVMKGVGERIILFFRKLLKDISSRHGTWTQKVIPVFTDH